VRGMKLTRLQSFMASALCFTGIAFLAGAAPGFRPESKWTGAFLEKLDTSRVAVFPTVIRTSQGTEYSATSQKQAVAFLTEKGLGTPGIRDTKLDLGKTEAKYQYDLFQSSLKAVGKAVQKQEGADYFLVFEQLLTTTPSGEIALGGIHVYVLDEKGRNAFSFLLNSHHGIFVQAGLKSADASDEGRETLVLKGTRVALAALEEQIKSAAERK
jgi:hypothetical protein